MRFTSIRAFSSALWLSIVLLFAAATPARAQTLMSDLPDYAPGATAWLTGAGFAADEPVQMHVVNVNGLPSPGDTPWWVTADSNGGFVTSWQVCEDECVGESFFATADGEYSALHASTAFTDANCGTFGAGIVGSVIGNDPASCYGFQASTSPNINNPDFFDVKEGGSYTMTINNVSECGGSEITVVLDNVFIANTFCFVATRVGTTNSFVGSFTMPDPACHRYSISYKCGATASCDTTGAIQARGPTSATNNCRTVRLRTSHFDANCAPTTIDECCSYPALSGVPPDETVECGNIPSAANVTPSQSCEQCIANPIQFVEFTTQGPAGTCAFSNYMITRNWIETDSCGNRTVGVQVITVADTTPPSISAPGANATIECPASPVFTPPNGSDLCGGTATLEEVSDVTTPGACIGSYSRTKTWRFVDACGNASPSVSQTIDVVDTTPPLIGAPGSSAEVECSGPELFTPPTASDACGGATVVEESDVTTNYDCTLAGHVKYTRTKTWHAVDGCGNVSPSVFQSLDVVDSTAPLIGAPGPNMTVECTTVPVFTPPTASDSCSNVSVVEEPEVATILDCSLAGHVKLSRTKRWHAIDDCGNVSASVSQTINVADTTAPLLSGAGPDMTIDCTATAVFTAPTATDDCSSASVILDSDVTSNLDCTLAGHVKSSRKLTWHAVDSCGNVSAQVSQTINVADTVAPTLVVPADVLGAPANELCAIPVAIGLASAADNCGGPVTLTNDAPAQYPIGITIVNWTATDECGNVTVGQQRIQVFGRICAGKFYDANADGIKDRNEDPIVGWKFVATNLSDGSVYIGYTGASGRVCMDVSAGNYTVNEVAPSGNWVATTPPVSVTIDANNCWAECRFGNYCFRAPGDGYSIAFWSSAAGQRVLTQHDPAWRQILNVMDLRNANGSHFDVPTGGPSRAAIQVFQSWLAGANQTNMAYMLSAQLAVTTLAIQFKGLDNHQLFVVPGGVKTQTNVCIVPMLSTGQPLACGFPLLRATSVPGSTACGCSANDAVVTIGELTDLADCLLGSYPTTTTPGLSRTYEECVKDLLDMVNNNGNPRPPSGYPCGGVTQYINPSAGACRSRLVTESSATRALG